MRELVGFIIEMSIDDAPALFLALSADGAVNRAGSAKRSSDEKDVFIAQTDGSLFRQVARSFDESWFERGGLYEIPGDVGPRHLLKLSFVSADHRGVALVFDYRADSLLPPGVQAFVRRALDVTQAWYDQQRQLVADLDAHAGTRSSPSSSVSPKPWWKFWETS